MIRATVRVNIPTVRVNIPTVEANIPTVGANIPTVGAPTTTVRVHIPTEKGFRNVFWGSLKSVRIVFL